MARLLKDVRYTLKKIYWRLYGLELIQKSKLSSALRALPLLKTRMPNCQRDPMPPLYLTRLENIRRYMLLVDNGFDAVPSPEINSVHQLIICSPRENKQTARRQIHRYKCVGACGFVALSSVEAIVKR